MLLITVKTGRPVQDLYYAVALHIHHKVGQQLMRVAFLFQMPRICGSDVAAGRVSMLLYCVSCWCPAVFWCQWPESWYQLISTRSFSVLHLKRTSRRLPPCSANGAVASLGVLGFFPHCVSEFVQEENQSQEKWTIETKCCEKDDTLPLE